MPSVGGEIYVGGDAVKNSHRPGFLIVEFIANRLLAPNLMQTSTFLRAPECCAMIMKGY